MIGRCLWLDPLQCLRRSDVLRSSVVEFSFTRYLISEKLGDKNEGHLEALRQRMEDALNSSDTNLENTIETVAEGCSVDNTSAVSEMTSTENESEGHLEALSQRIEDASNSSDTNSENSNETVAEGCSVDNMSAVSEMTSTKNESEEHLEALRQRMEDVSNSSDKNLENTNETVAEGCSVDNMSAVSEMTSTKNESTKNLQVR